MALFEKDFSNKQSKLVKNYLFFQEQIMNSTLSAEEIIDAIERLLIIDISIDKEDNPQLIFESINSTGMKNRGTLYISYCQRFFQNARAHSVFRSPFRRKLCLQKFPSIFFVIFPVLISHFSDSVIDSRE